MTVRDVYEFASDRPIKKLDDDKLGRTSFASDLANAIASWNGEDSLVVALHGDWGSGKSSIKNMALSKLNMLHENKPNVIQFSPWEWAAQERITDSFFQEISKTINREDKSETGKKLAKTLRKYGHYLETGEVVATGLSAILPFLFIAATILGIGGSIANEDWIRNITTSLLITIGVIAATLKWGNLLLSRISTNILDSAKAKEQNLNEIRNELTELLKNQASPLIIVLDDLDRLNSSELKMIFQLIKANSEFPNVVFLLLFQRDVVENKMNDGMQLGRDYLEKIIQVPFDIPKIETTRLHDLLFERLDRTIGTNTLALELFDSTRWANIFNGAMNKYFETLRNVYRYTSTLSFHFTLLQGKSAFEVNPVDLMAIECLRVFEPDVYKEIARSKAILTKLRAGQSESDIKLTKHQLENIIKKSTTDKKEAVEQIIKQLFPTVEWALGGMNYSREVGDSWLREMRICHHSIFDKYFQFSIPRGELSNSDLKELIQLTSRSDELSRSILLLEEEGVSKNALSQLEAYINEIPLENGESFIKAILDIGDVIEHETKGFTFISAHTHAVRLVVWFLRRIENDKDRGSLLISCFKKSDGLSIIDHMLSAEVSRREKGDPDQVLADEELESLKDELIEKFDKMSKNEPDKLLSNNHLISLLYTWKKLGKEQEVKKWLKDNTKSTEDCLRLLNKFKYRKYTQSMGDYNARATTIIKLEDIEEFIDVSTIQEKTQELSEENLVPDYKETLTAFRTALNRN
ncbi:AAA family ATPase [Cobetia amphilecti]|uniref:KAP family P-loop NTPase fold protein n=1 Tax=Cobetia amphilecti TaxID=1055104 RepID=UPI001CDAA6D8|nr:P-loop NTPase fold protein [Cobetia amphilecti]UBU47893.1 AAA family ATPase [Cobetia amphilecti]